MTVTAVEDSDRVDEMVTLSNNPSGAEYDNVDTVSVDLIVNVADNDTATSVSVSKTALTVGEEDATGGSYTVALIAEPTADVTVTVAGHAGTDVTPSPTTLVFTMMNWETAQTVTVTAGNDADTADDTVILTHSVASTDPGYRNINIDSVEVTVTDNDSRPPTPGGGGGGSGGGRSSGGGGGGGGSSNRAPEITGPKSLQYPEHSTEPVATYEAEDPEGTEIRWEIEDSDSEHFRISDEGVLRFITPPDYENPVDFRLNNTYEIRLLAVRQR